MKVQILLAGVGGQGILFMSRILAELGLRSGLDVIGSETHGMSQRGGSVIAHLKLGKFSSPLIREGAADFLYALEINEGYRALPFLKQGGVVFVNLSEREDLNEKILSHLKKRKIVFKKYDANLAAARIGSFKTLNVALFGYSVGTGLVPFRYNNIKEVIVSISKPEDVKLNLKALETGWKEGKLHSKDLRRKPTS